MRSLPYLFRMPCDPSLALPPAPVAAPSLTGPSDTLIRAGSARPRPFLLAVPGCSVRGTETRGVEEVEHRARILIRRLSVADATGGNALLAPAQARRELIGAHGSVLETLLASAEGLLGQWTVPGGRTGDLTLLMSLSGAAWRADGPFVRADGPEGVLLLQLLPAPSWSVREERGGLAVTARVRAPAGESVRLLATSARDWAGASARLLRLGVVSERRTESELVAQRSRRLRIHTGVEELDDCLAWAAARLDAAHGSDGDIVHELASGESFPFDPDSRRAWCALGMLATGSVRHPRIITSSLLGALAYARAALWSGARVDGAAGLPALTAAEDIARDSLAESVVRRAALLELADAIEPWQGRERATALRALAATLSTDKPAPSAGGLRLPTLGAGAVPGDPVAGALGAALELPGRLRYVPPLDDPPPGALRALTAWACLNDGHLERGVALFRRHIADGFAHGAGLWPDGGRIHDAASAALVPLVFVHGLLGVRGDAHYGRLRMAPRLPKHWTRLDVSGLAVGDATVRMSYEATAGLHRFRIAQESGRVPLMLIFEPSLPAPSDAVLRVDGTVADVEVGAAWGRARARLQLPLDKEREVSLSAE